MFRTRCLRHRYSGVNRRLGGVGVLNIAPREGGRETWPLFVGCWLREVNVIRLGDWFKTPDPGLSCLLAADGDVAVSVDFFADQAK